MSVESTISGSPVELASQIDSSLKSLLVLVGQSLRARGRLQAALRHLRIKAASSTLQSKEELILSQHYQHHQGIPGLRALERECVKYDSLVKDLGSWIGSAKEALEEELIKAKAREEVERLEQQEKDRKAEEKRISDELEKSRKEAEAVKSQPTTNPEQTKVGQANESIVIDDDDEEEDDAPLALASRGGAGEKNPTDNPSIDLTNDSPTGGKPFTLTNDAASNSNATTIPDPTSLLASLSGLNANANKDGGDSGLSSSMALDDFDFSQLGLQQMDPTTGYSSTAQPSEFQSDSLDFNMDFLDYSAMSGGNGMGSADGGMGDTNDLFGNIDFSALLGGGGSGSDTKK